MSEIKNRIVLVTGGDSGLGKALVEKMCKEGAKAIVIWSNNPDALGLYCKELQQLGYPVKGYVVDVAQVASVTSVGAQVIEEVGVPDIIINNAGIVTGKYFTEHSMQDIERTMQVNAIGPMIVTQVFLKEMIQRGNGHIVNIASAAGLTPNPRMSVYAASKWSVIGWSESLRLELEMISSEFHVLTVTPSYINTGMFDGAKAPILTRILEKEEVAIAIIKAIKANRILLRKPFTIHLLPLFRGILPTRWFDRVIGKGFGVYSSMDAFMGRS